MRRLAQMVILCYLTASSAYATGVLYTSVDLTYSELFSDLYSLSRAEYQFQGMFEPTPTVSGRHTIDGGNIAVSSGSGSGLWSDLLTVTATTNQCYRATITATESNNNTTQGAGTAQTCAIRHCYWVAHPQPNEGGYTMPRYSTEVCGTTISVTAAANNGYLFDSWSGDGSGSSTTLTVVLNQDKEFIANFVQAPPPSADPLPDIEDACNPQCSPIVINFADGGYRLTGANSPVLFDMSGSGHPRLIGWTAAGEDEAFLWLDRNHNHRVTGGAELFGNFTPLQNGYLAKNGFEALAEFDANHDGVIDNQDPIWSQLMLWRDLNHNGISEPNEIEPLDASDVTAIDLHDHWTGRYDSWGNAFRYESLISIKNPSGHAARRQPVYDIFFVSVSQ